jgi:hypothetical protein
LLFPIKTKQKMAAIARRHPLILALWIDARTAIERGAVGI